MQHGPGHAQAGLWPAPSAPRVNEVQHKRTKTGGTLTTTKYAPPPGYVPPVAQIPAYAAWPHAAPNFNPQQAYYGAYAQAAAYSNYAAQYAQYYQQQAYYAQAAQATHQAYPTTPHPGSEQAQYPGAIAHVRSSSVITTTTDPKQTGPNDDLDEDDEEYCEFTRACYYATREAEIVKELSIGLVLARTACPANAALPATWSEANAVAAIAQTAPERHDPTLCLSVYHNEENKAAQLVSIRDTSLWAAVKDDYIFRAFPYVATAFISRPELRHKYRSRFDQAWADAKPDLKRPRPELQRSASGPGNKKRIFSQTDAAQEVDVADKRHRQTDDAHHAMTQEDILARLGVTGAPKPVHKTVVPSAKLAMPIEPLKQNGTAHVAELVRSAPEVTEGDDSDDKSEQMDLDSAEPSPNSSPQPSPQASPGHPKESRWTRLAKEYQKRSYDDSGFDQQDKDLQAIHQDKRRK